MPIFQYAADDNSFAASEQRRINRERQQDAGKALSASTAANPSGKPELELVKVSKNPAFGSLLDDQMARLKVDLNVNQPKQLKTLETQRAELNPLMKSSVLEDVEKIGTAAKDYVSATRTADDDYRRLLNEGRDLSVQTATGNLERGRMAKNPYLGWSTANTYDAAQAIAPIYNQAAQDQQRAHQAALDKIYSAENAVVGRRQPLYASLDAYSRGQIDDNQRLQAGNLANLNAFEQAYLNNNFLGVGGQTGYSPYTLPAYSSNFRLPAMNPYNRAALNAVSERRDEGLRPTPKKNAWELYREWTGFYPNDKRHKFDRDMYEMLGGEVRDPAARSTPSAIPGYPDDRPSFEPVVSPEPSVAPGQLFQYPSPYKESYLSDPQYDLYPDRV